ncbi:hypothetical protein [Leifsonia sp. fls2-241-R2A-40a]|uniref:hypothetical protein n=1 Tax=Leifsonia sp. fls2-241-R2A-40a TaxID=3040290 RepID=UPI00254CA4EA|nr:hypothetical protein [Leifsonia sp. fls2-241-R2A-40a]
MDVLDWLLDSDPAIRWQVLQDLMGAGAEDVAAERARVAREGWGATFLSEQAEDGLWDGGTYRPGWIPPERDGFDAWSGTHFSLQQLVDFGLDPASPEARRAIERVRENVRWEHAGEPYFDGETEPCINGVALTIAVYFGQNGDRIAETLVDSRLDDGGWNCWAEYGAKVSSFHSTICSVEGLSAWLRAGGDDPRAAETLTRGEEYLLERSLYRRRSDGTIPDPRMTMLSYPVRWYHDALRGLEHFRLQDRRDPRLADAVELVRGKADADGRWVLENIHEGPVIVEFDMEGFQSKWLTLRALRVLRWWDAA